MSSTLVDAHRLAVRFGERTLFDDLTLRVSAGDRLAVIGENGTGKSTLLRVLAGLRAPDGGRLAVRCTTLMLAQLGRRDERPLTVREAAEDALGVRAASAALRAAERQLTEAGDVLDERIVAHATALERWLAAGGAEIDALLGAGAERVGLSPALLDRPLATLSSGQAVRAALLPLAARPPALLVLDEPTNHLDASGRAALLALLEEHAGAVVLASHDRALLAHVAGRVLELRPRGEAPVAYAGGWEVYEREQAVAAEQARQAYEQAVTRRAELRAAEAEIRRRAAASRRRLAVNAHDGDKHQKEYFRARADGVAARGRTVAARAAAVEVPSKPWQTDPLALVLTPEEEHAAAVVALEDVVVGRGDWQLGPISLAVAPGERILLRGPNGAGKSTLLEALAGTLAPTRGARSAGPRAVVSVLGAVERRLAGREPVAEAVRALTGLAPAAARMRLAQAGLGAEVAARPAATLSPGERTRAELAVLGALRTTCLLLDEPSNHLDLRSLQALETALDGWPGALVVATHDEAFAARLRPTREVALDAAVA